MKRLRVTGTRSGGWAKAWRSNWDQDQPKLLQEISLLLSLSAFTSLRILQAKKQIAAGRRDGHAVRAVNSRDGTSIGAPTAAHQIGVLQQVIIARGRPRYHHAVWADIFDGQIGQTRRLHSGDDAPKAAGQGIVTAGHRAAGIRLTDGATQRIITAAARTAATGDFIPVNRVGLRKADGRNQQTKK